MLEQFLRFIKKNKLFDPKEKILLAVSGGMDSVVMADLFHRAKFKFAIAHCNFQLREKESDGDEKFVRALAKKYNVKFYVKRFNTEKESKTKKISIQMAARDLRYHWFESLVRTEGYSYVATAHHLSDSIETFFINLLRGTGIEGISGIDVKSTYIVRPLLFATREEIEKYSKEQKITYREDSSNQSDDYLRNRIRHHLIPAFKALNPKFENTMSGNLSHFSFAAKILRQQVADQTGKLLKKEKDFYSIALKELKRQEDAEQLLYELMRPFGFNYIQCIEMLSEGSSTKSGKVFLTESFRGVRDRDNLLLNALHTTYTSEIQIPRAKKKTLNDSFELKTSFGERKKNTTIPAEQTVQWLDADLLKFPVTLRKWKAGDYFYPLGMKHHKKLSDFFIDRKVSLPVKENTYVLLSENEIVCILGHRIDDRYKVTDKTKKIYKVELKYK